MAVVMTASLFSKRDIVESLIAAIRISMFFGPLLGVYAGVHLYLSRKQRGLLEWLLSRETHKRSQKD